MVLRLIALLAICFGAPLTLKSWTYGFNVRRLDLKLPFNPDWAVSILPQEKEALFLILSQSYTYLARGAQCFVFESQDGLYVLKIFQKNRHLFSHHISDPKKEREKIDFVLGGCAIAFTQARRETALVHLHLNQTVNELPFVSIRDSIGRPFSLDLNRYWFTIQKRVRPLEDVFFEAEKSGRLSTYLRSCFSLFQRRAAKGIWNSEVCVGQNIGFLGDEAIEIDFGRYMFRSEFFHPHAQRMELLRCTNQLRTFIERNLPGQLSLYDEELTQFMQTL